MKQKNKNLLTIAGILSILEGTIICISNNIYIIGLAIMAMGIIFMNIGKKPIEEQSENKVLLIILGIVNIFINLISAILLFIVVDNLTIYKRNKNQTNAPPEESQELKDKKNVDLILKLGVGMVLISGLIFATTSWDFIQDIFKALLLVLFGVFFLGLSHVTETKLNLKKSSYVYWILSMAFFLLTIVGLEFFGALGPFLTFDGEGKYLAYFLVALTFGLLSNITYFKYKRTYLVYASYIGYMVATHNVIMQANPSLIFSLIILSVMNVITYVLNNKGSKLNEVSGIFIYLLPLLICAKMFYEESVLLKLIATAFSIFNIIYLKSKNKDDILNIFGIVIIYSLVITSISSFELEYSTKIITMFSLLSIYSVFNNLDRNTELLTEINNGMYTVFTIIMYMNLIEEKVLLALLVAVVYLLIGVSSKLNITNLNRSHVFNISLPIAIPLIILPFCDLLGLGRLIYGYGFGVSSVFYCLAHHILTRKSEKKRFLVYAIIATILTLLTSVSANEVLVSLYPIVTSFYITGVFYNDKIKTNVILPYIYFLICAYVPIVLMNVLNIHIVFTTILFIWVALMAMILLNSKLINKITQLAIVLPLFHLISEGNLTDVVTYISISVLILYITFLIVKLFVKENRQIISIIGIVIALLIVIFRVNIWIGLYIGLVGILIMIFGYNSKEFNGFFKFGIGIIVVNMFIQLFALWQQVQTYLYFLIIGLGLIGFVTYNEIKKIDNKNNTKKEKDE